MLRSRTLSRILLQTPLRIGVFTRTAPSARFITNRPSSLRNSIQQTHFSSSPLRTSLVARLSRWPRSSFQRTRNARWNSDKPKLPAASENGNQAPQTYSQRFKDLSRRYGYAAVGVYLGLSVLDFPFCFLTVRLVGPERVGEVEHAIVDSFWSLISIVVPSMGPEDRTASDNAIAEEVKETQSVDSNGHKHNDNASMYVRRNLMREYRANNNFAGIWTQLILAYAIHKSLLVFRVPLTAAVTPKVVKTLRSWGWNIGRPAKRVKSAS